MAAKQDTEITLGTGKLLGIFFVMVVICGAFFTMGYLFGHSSAGTSPSTAIVSTIPTTGNTGSKPSANGAKATNAQNCPPGSSNCTPGSGPDSSFYSTVSAKEPSASQPATSPAAPAAAAPSADGAPENKPAATGSYMVQVAAVSKQEDADILVNALRKKQYPVFVVANVPGDSLYHVQVGPFSDPKDAEAMRSRLAGDGYNAIVKK